MIIGTIFANYVFVLIATTKDDKVVRKKDLLGTGTLGGDLHDSFDEVAVSLSKSGDSSSSGAACLGHD